MKKLIVITTTNLCYLNSNTMKNTLQMYAYNFIYKQNTQEKTIIFNIIFVISDFYSNMLDLYYKSVTF